MRALIFSLLPAFLCATEYGNPPQFSTEQHAQRTFLYGECLFASPSVEGLAYVIRANGTNPLQGKIVEPSERWSPGLRIGLGSHFAHDSWEFSGDWSYFSSDIVQTIHADNLTPLYMDASSYSQSEPIQQAKEHWTFSLNALSATLSRLYFLSQELDIRPQIGLIVSWIDQDISISYRNNTSASGLVAYETTIANDSFRVGPSLGTRLNWHIRRKFRIFGGAVGAICARGVDVQQIQTAVGNTDGDFRLNFSEHVNRMQPYLDCQLGIAWGSFIKKDRNFCEIALQYEAQYFWHEFESRILYEQVGSSLDRSLDQLGDLSLQSVAVRLRLDF